ncbi:hypothetical protein GT348_00200 [Aristophania vespae]|uniref:Uncharacterized protein n=1 Tax=Aristophania vespae TaxID=2697033 RepID=A0A6P1N8U3_9PROT|nr:hypothetical protein [Aristophania vespae]QHI94955.1 hypothetical protein GT348_00200 [Aristophania vespae]
MASVLATFHDYIKQSGKITRDSSLRALQKAVLSTEMRPVREYSGEKISRMLEMFAQPGVGELLRHNMRNASKKPIPPKPEQSGKKTSYTLGDRLLRNTQEIIHQSSKVA